MAVAVMIGAAMIPALAAGPAHAVGSSHATVRAVAAGWVVVRTYPTLVACNADGPIVAASAQWRCAPSPRVPSAYDLHVWR
jgi:hypothetical protein